MPKPDSPLWGPLHAPHHWGESLFGYYLTQDEGVLRKHAQMLADAGVDVVVFDVTNQVTYQADYQALLRVWSEVRAAGNRTPCRGLPSPPSGTPPRSSASSGATSTNPACSRTSGSDGRASRSSSPIPP
ncbi:MAG: hypothetical protein M5U12_37150 [Verrucomicrobia bacterium]|nr:hypothetical protein [Verrucomicrobiota bacterium]